MQELCQALKDKRKELGYSIEEVVDKTKLHPSVIRDIKDGNLANINPTYLRGFMRIYASFLGVDTGDALKQQVPSSSKKPKEQEEKKRTYQFKRPAPKKISPKVKQTIILIGAAIIAFFILTLTVKAIVRKLSKARTAKPEPASEGTNEVSTPVEIEGQEISVSLTVKRDCFVRVRADDKLIFEGVLRKGIVENWEAKKLLDFKLSDGSAVSIEVNGKALPPLSSTSKPIRSLKITPSGISVEK